MKTLFCTVGGTRAPILAAIREHAPDRVVFICSSDDQATWAKGSYTEVETKEPTIATEAGLPAGSWEVIRVPSDDPDQTVAAITGPLGRAAKAGKCIADYTGGTKSMSAALFAVASQTRDVRISLVTGPRANLVKMFPEVAPRARLLPLVKVERARLEERVAECWSRYAYGEADRAIETALPEARDDVVDRWQTMSRAYAMWDAWNHRGAFDLLRIFKQFVPDEALRALHRMATAPSNREADARLAVDMYAAASRRACSQHYDAAVLRLYRVLEWVAQWSLRWEHQVDTGNVRKDDARVFHLAKEAPNGKFVLSCNQAWRAVAELDGPLQGVAARLGNDVLKLALKRNESVLAHGQGPLGEKDFESCLRALQSGVWPAFLGVAHVPEVQLPNTLPGREV